MRPPSFIQTERLDLRQPTIGDAATIFTDYAQDTEVTKYVIWRPHKDIGETRKFLSYCINAWETGSEYAYVIIRKSDGRLLGTIAAIMNKDRVYLGYVIARNYWGQGFVAEALRPIIDWALAQSEISRVSALCDCENLASVRVMEKVGMNREGVLRGHIKSSNISFVPRDVFSYSIVK